MQHCVCSCAQVTIHRSRLIEDAYAGLAHLGPGLKARLQVGHQELGWQGASGLKLGYCQRAGQLGSIRSCGTAAKTALAIQSAKAPP